MSFKSYHPSKQNSESDNNNHHYNGNNHVHIKYAPIKIIDNKVGNSEERRKYPQLNLRFHPIDETTVIFKFNLDTSRSHCYNTIEFPSIINSISLFK